MGWDSKTGDPLEHLRQLANALGAVLWLRDLREERLLYVSPAFEKIWGRRVEDLLANPKLWVDSIHPDDRERALSGAIDARDGAHRQEYRILRPDGSIRHIRDRAFPILDAKGKLVRLAGVAEDVTPK
jgi:PAS domain S-box-containing protein